MSQSPEGSSADFHLWAFSTSTRSTSASRNPPKGPQPISTERKLRKEAQKEDKSQSPEGSSADFHQEVRKAWQQGATKSQSPEGSSADFHDRTVTVRGCNVHVAIPRRVLSRFPLNLGLGAQTANFLSQSPEGSSADFHLPQGAVVLTPSSQRRNPPKGPQPISTDLRRRGPGRGIHPSQSPEGSSADFHRRTMRWCPSRLRGSQSPEGSSADFHCGPLNPPGISRLRSDSANLLPRSRKTCTAPCADGLGNLSQALHSSRLTCHLGRSANLPRFSADREVSGRR